MAELRNTINIETEKVAEEPKPAKPSNNKKKPAGGKVKSILEGSFLVRDKVIGLLPFLVYLTFIGTLYIFNSNYANRTIISIKPEHIEAWLNPDPANLQALYGIFDDKRHPFYEHKVAA